MLKKNRALTEDFTKLYLELENEGFFEPSYTHNILRFMELLVMAAVGYALIQCQNILAKVIGSVLIGLMQGRSGWMQHESGHLSLSGSPKLDRIFHAIFFGKQVFFFLSVSFNIIFLALQGFLFLAVVRIGIQFSMKSKLIFRRITRVTMISFNEANFFYT